MTRATALVLATIVVIVALVTGNGAAMMRSLERGLFWGFGREISHEIVHSHR